MRRGIHKNPSKRQNVKFVKNVLTYYFQYIGDVLLFENPSFSACMNPKNPKLESLFYIDIFFSIMHKDGHIKQEST